MSLALSIDVVITSHLKLINHNSLKIETKKKQGLVKHSENTPVLNIYIYISLDWQGLEQQASMKEFGSHHRRIHMVLLYVQSQVPYQWKRSQEMYKLMPVRLLQRFGQLQQSRLTRASPRTTRPPRQTQIAAVMVRLFSQEQWSQSRRLSRYLCFWVSTIFISQTVVW